MVKIRGWSIWKEQKDEVIWINDYIDGNIY